MGGSGIHRVVIPLYDPLKGVMEASTNILVPGRGVVNLEAEAVNKAIQNHDERLRFGFNEQNGDWVVYIAMPREFKAEYYIGGEPVYPIMGYGKKIPNVSQAITRLKFADTRQHGMRILDEMNKDNEKLKAAQRDKADEQLEETAEHIEFEARKAGLTEKYTKVFT